MSGVTTTLQAHLATGLTTICRCWRVIRKDGVTLGFTDHDRDLSFDGTTFKAGSGLVASALQNTTGLSVDNSEAIGALSDAAISETDVRAGRFDGATVEIWKVNWADPAARDVQFRGTLGELQQVDGAFRAELRGLTEALNQPQGRLYQRECGAVLGDGACRVALSNPVFAAEDPIVQSKGGLVFSFAGLGGYGDGWFERGRLEVVTGEGRGLTAMIKRDRRTGAGREIEVWEELRIPIAAGDRVRLEAGCDKRWETCRSKFNNLYNFQGFPFIPGDDWLASYPVQNGQNDGGSLIR